MDKKVVVSAPCKINLYLQIDSATDDGYHQLTSIMQSADLCDIVTISAADGAAVSLYCSDESIPVGEANLAYKAARAFCDYAAVPFRGLEIAIEKHIPAEAGLAGGSADAAGVLVGLNYLFNTQYSPKELCHIGVRLGADVPFCIKGGSRLARGIGERFHRLKNLSDAECTFVIIKPSWNVSTKEAFEKYDRMVKRIGYPGVDELLEAWDRLELKRIGRGMFNIFEEVLPSMHTDFIKAGLGGYGASGSVMSGSGSSVVGLFEAEEDAARAAEALSEHYDFVYTAKPLSGGARVITT